MYCVIYDQLNLAQYRRRLDTKRRCTSGGAQIKERDKKMIDEETTRASNDSPSRHEGNDSLEEPTRDEERGEASEPDAPTSGEENSGMNTILDGGLGTGVQNDLDDE
jgi:hypothetical protein